MKHHDVIRQLLTFRSFVWLNYAWEGLALSKQEIRRALEKLRSLALHFLSYPACVESYSCLDRVLNPKNQI